MVKKRPEFGMFVITVSSLLFIGMNRFTGRVLNADRSNNLRSYEQAHR